MADLVPTYRIGNFGAYRVSNPFQAFSLDFRYGIDPLLVGTETSGGGGISPLDSDRAMRLTVGGSLGDAATVQTHETFGERMTVAKRVAFALRLDSAAVVGQTARWGVFSNGVNVNGAYFMLKDGVFGIAIRKNGGTEFFTPQSSFNVDRMDGSGPTTNPSGITLDLTKVNKYEAQIEFLNSSAFINGVLVHRINTSNLTTETSTSGERTPIRASIENTAAASANALTLYDATVWNEGESLHHGATFSRSASKASVSTTELPLLSIRPKLLFGLGGAGPHPNKVDITPLHLSVSEAARIVYAVRLSPTLTGPVWTSHDAESAIEYDTTATAVSGGRVLFEWVADQSLSIGINDFQRNAFKALVLEYPTNFQRFITITARRTSGPGVEAECSLTWSEDR